MKKALFVIIMITIAVTTGCTSHSASIKYKPLQSSSQTDNSLLIVKVGNVIDSRGTQDNWLGAIRGGYGNPLKKIYTDGRTSEVVKKAFEDALRTRNMLAPTSTSEFRIDVNLHKFDTSYYFNKEAHAYFTVTVIHISSARTVFTQSYRTDNAKSGAGAGIFGDPDALAIFANETLNETIDKALNDEDFLASISSTPSSTLSKTTTRLEELKALKEKGLISNDEYEKKRKVIIDEL